MIASRARTEQEANSSCSPCQESGQLDAAGSLLRSRCYDALGERDNIASFSLGFALGSGAPRPRGSRGGAPRRLLQPTPIPPRDKSFRV